MRGTSVQNLDAGGGPVAEAQLVQVHRHDDAVSVTPPRRIDQTVGQNLSSTLLNSFDTPHPRQVRIDLSETLFIDDQGLRALRAARGRAKLLGCELRIIRPRALTVRRALISGGLDSLLTSSTGS